MRILAVDDDPIVLELLSKFTDEVGEHKIVGVSSGADALNILSSSRNISFNCFLLDIQMPGMDGIELTKAIRNTNEYATTPILMLTAMSDKRFVDAAFSAGATDYITKPFESIDLKGRLALVSELVQARLSRTKKIFAAQAASRTSYSSSSSQYLELHDPIPIYDVENLIEHIAMENYVAQLSRTALFGSTAFAIMIRRVEEHHRLKSRFEFCGMISDVAEVISDTLSGNQFLMSYAGNGTFMCVTESGWRPDVTALMDAVNLSLSRTELYTNEGQPIYVRVSIGKAIRLIWKSKENVMEAIASAQESAELASMENKRTYNDFWLLQEK